MKPHPKIRKTVKWAGAFLTPLLVASWIASMVLWMQWWFIKDWMFVAGEGGIGLAHFSGFGEVESPLAWGVKSFEWGRVGWFYHYSNAHWSVTGVPVWSLSVPALLTTVVASYFDTLARRRTRMGACKNCGYDLSATFPTSICPECGSSRTFTPPAN